MTLQMPASIVGEASVLGVPTFQWKFLSTAEKAAVDKSLDVIRAQRMKSVSVSIVDNTGMPFTGTLLVTQESTDFISAVGWWGVVGLSTNNEYLAMTPSKSAYIWAPWNIVEKIRGVYDFNGPDRNYRDQLEQGIVDFHLKLTPHSLQCCSDLPGWAKILEYDSLKETMRQFVSALVTHFKGRVQYYHLWDEANAEFGNDNWPLERIFDIIKMEAVTIRSIDSNARVVVDLANFPHRGPSDLSVEDFVQALLNAEVPFDVIGVETHYGDGTGAGGAPDHSGGIDTLYERLVVLATFGKPLYVWEDGLASSIDPGSLPHWQSIGLMWHGEPSEEKQAEFMVAETLVYLGNPLVLGVQWYVLQDQPWDVGSYIHMGVIRYPDRSRKPSFYALQNLWMNLTTLSTIQPVNGVARFSGLAGEYAIAAEGYLPAKIHVAEQSSLNSFSITLTSRNPNTISMSTSLKQASITQLGTFPGSSQLILLGTVALIVVIALTLFTFRKRSMNKQ